MSSNLTESTSSQRVDTSSNLVMRTKDKAEEISDMSIEPIWIFQIGFFVFSRNWFRKRREIPI